MRILVIAAVAALAAACSPGGGAKQRIVERCMEGAEAQQSQDQARTMCNCMADRLAEGVTPAQLNIIAKGDEATAEEQASLQSPEVMQAVSGALMSCLSTLEPQQQ